MHSLFPHNVAYGTPEYFNTKELIQMLFNHTFLPVCMGEVKKVPDVRTQEELQNMYQHLRRQLPELVYQTIADKLIYEAMGARRVSARRILI